MIPLVCKQMYVDFVGGGLFYKNKEFYFKSTSSMMNYLWVINPAHKDMIRTIHLVYASCSNNWSLSKKPLVSDCSISLAKT